MKERKGAKKHMTGYFVIVKAKVWDSEGAEEYNCIKLFKIANCADLGEQLDKEFGNDLMDFSVFWIGGENIGLDIDENIAKCLQELN